MKTGEIDGAGNCLAKLAKTRSLVRSGVSLGIGLLLAALLAAVAVVQPGVMGLWVYWLVYLCPAGLIWLNVREIRRELDLRRRVREGEIEIIEADSGYICVKADAIKDK